jgi:hypothetical protein
MLESTGASNCGLQVDTMAHPSSTGGKSMLVTFKSGVCADVMMFVEVAQQMMEIMGKEFTPRGVFTVEQLPHAISRLKQAVAEDRQLRQGAAPPPEDEEEGEERRERVSITQRALPLIELLECSLREEKPVLWGV